MKKGNDKENAVEEDYMLPEYDLRGKPFVRGKYYQAYQNGALILIHNEDGTVTVKPVHDAYRAVVLAPDVRKHFPDSESVNETLRALIALIPAKKRRAKMPRARSRVPTAKKVRA